MNGQCPSHELASILDRLASIEERLVNLERNSHPPVDLTKPVYQAMAKILEDAASLAAYKCDGA